MDFIRHEQYQNKLKRTGKRRYFYRTRPQQRTREIKLTRKTGYTVHGMSRDITRSVFPRTSSVPPITSKIISALFHT